MRTARAELRDSRGDEILNKPILVTGGAGFIGSHLVEALLRAGETVRVLDDLSSGMLDNLSNASSSNASSSNASSSNGSGGNGASGNNTTSGNGRLTVTIGSVRDLPLFRQQIDGCGQVYHLAASVGVAMVTSRASDCLRNNVEGVQNLFTALAEQASPPRVILFSSSEVYGKSGQMPLREDGDLVLGPSHVARWSYASGKVMGEFLALAEHARTGVPVTIVRCFNTCGPRQRSAYGMVVPRFLDQALAGKPITVYGDGLQTRCFSYVDDVVQGVLRLAACAESVGEIYNIGSDRETTIQELAERVVALVPSASRIRRVPYGEVYGESFEDVRRRVPDLSRIRRRIGPLPMTDLDTLLRSTLAWRTGGGAANTAAEADTTPRASASRAV